MKQIIPIIIIFVLGSCTTTNFITIDVRQPAFVSFPPEVTNVLIVDNSPMLTADTDSVKEHQENNYLSADSVKSIFVNSMQLFMNEENYFGKVELYPYNTYKGDSAEVTALTERKIQAICNEKNADVLVSLDYITSSGELGSDMEGYIVLKAKQGCLFRVYSNQGVSFVSPVALIDSLVNANVDHWLNPRKNTEVMNSMISELTINNADMATSLFIPSWQKKDRWYYSNNSSEMKQAAKLVQEGEWEKAALIWGDLYNNEEKDSKKMLLASNIALANECLDDIPNALLWINIAYEMLPSRSQSDFAIQIAQYKHELVQRENNIPKLWEQLGIDNMDSTE